MGAACSPAAPASPDRSTTQRPSRDHRRFLLTGPHRGTLARPARVLWPVADCGDALLSLDGQRALAAHSERLARKGRCYGPDRLVRAPRGQHHHSRPSACGWCQRRPGQARPGLLARGLLDQAAHPLRRQGPPNGLRAHRWRAARPAQKAETGSRAPRVCVRTECRVQTTSAVKVRAHASGAPASVATISRLQSHARKLRGERRPPGAG